jgi:hypothetical protein
MSVGVAAETVHAAATVSTPDPAYGTIVGCAASTVRGGRRAMVNAMANAMAEDWLIQIIAWTRL